jgi:hypothetical protein
VLEFDITEMTFRGEPKSGGFQVALGTCAEYSSCVCGTAGYCWYLPVTLSRRFWRPGDASPFTYYGSVPNTTS